MVRQTSLEAFKELKDKGTMGARHKIVYEIVARNPYITDREILHLANLQDRTFTDPNMIRPRRRELVKEGLLVECGKRPCTITNKKALVFKIKKGV